jgi:membrane-bound inhibitor of C-type lysozyme
LAAAASAVQAIIGLYNPQAKREKHSAAEHRYTCLSRDIVVKLVSGSDDAAYWEDVLKDSQRALDNIQAVAPEL